MTPANPTSVVRWKFIHIVTNVPTPLYLASPSALVQVDTLNGESFGSNLTGGYMAFDSTGLFFVSVMALGTKAQSGLGSLVLNASGCSFFPMDDFSWPVTSSFSMAYLVQATDSSAVCRPYVASTSPSQTIEFLFTVVKLIPD